MVGVPIDKLHPCYSRITSYRDLPEILVEQIGHFFERYKETRKGALGARSAALVAINIALNQYFDTG
jgi:inorganic pyrophosphatase